MDSREGRIFAMDGRQFLTSSPESYDVVVIDAFGSSSIPFHLVTAESFRLLASRLEPDGIVAINVEALRWDDLIIRSLAATLQKSFSEVLASTTPT